MASDMMEYKLRCFSELLDVLEKNSFFCGDIIKKGKEGTNKHKVMKFFIIDSLAVLLYENLES